jgi:alkaline phosphatase D
MTTLTPPTRRRFLQSAGIVGGASLLAPSLIGCVAPGPRWTRDPFTLGIASGDPRPEGFVLWTRLAPDPLSADPATPGGMSGGGVHVSYEISTDPSMRVLVRSGTTLAQP